jgi:hypothetical protein
LVRKFKVRVFLTIFRQEKIGSEIGAQDKTGVIVAPMGLERGQQTGRIFAHWLTVNFGQFFLIITKVTHIFGLLFPRLISIIIFDKYIIG